MSRFKIIFLILNNINIKNIKKMKIALSQLKTVTLSALAERLVGASKGGKYSISVSGHPLLRAVEEENSNYKQLVNKQAYS